jgi:excisionase family DNA binding protein
MSSKSRIVVDNDMPRRAAADSEALPRLYTVAATAAFAQVSTKTLRRWLDDGRIPFHRLGRQIRIVEDDLVAFLKQTRSR